MKYDYLYLPIIILLMLTKTLLSIGIGIAIELLPLRNSSLAKILITLTRGNVPYRITYLKKLNQNLC